MHSFKITNFFDSPVIVFTPMEFHTAAARFAIRTGFVRIEDALRTIRIELISGSAFELAAVFRRTRHIFDMIIVLAYFNIIPLIIFTDQMLPLAPCIITTEFSLSAGTTDGITVGFIRILYISIYTNRSTIIITIKHAPRSFIIQEMTYSFRLPYIVFIAYIYNHIIIIFGLMLSR